MVCWPNGAGVAVAAIEVVAYCGTSVVLVGEVAARFAPVAATEAVYWSPGVPVTWIENDPSERVVPVHFVLLESVIATG